MKRIKSDDVQRLRHIKNYCMYYDFLDYVNLEDLQFLIQEAERYYSEKQSLIEQLLEMGKTKMDDGRQLYELNLMELIEEYNDLKNMLEPCGI